MKIPRAIQLENITEVSNCLQSSFFSFLTVPPPPLIFSFLELASFLGVLYVFARYKYFHGYVQSVKGR